jgi:hypothetical protein
LGSYVRQITVHVSDCWYYNEFQYGPRHLLPIFSLFPKLYELEMSSLPTSLGNHTALIEALTALTAWESGPLSRLPQLRCLTIRGFGFLLLHLLELWPTLSFGYAPTVSPPTHSNLKLIHLCYRGPPSLEVLQWLIPDDGNFLQILKLTECWDIEETIELARRKGRYVRSLEVEVEQGQLSSYGPS